VNNLLSGERGFGVVFAVVFLLVGLRYRAWPALVISAALLGVALLRPQVLRGPNRWWMRLAALLARVTNPVMTAVLFYGVITPMGLAARALGKDSLRRRRDPQASTYWIARSPPGPRGDSMANQF